jgi:hypothetical protein
MKTRENAKPFIHLIEQAAHNRNFIDARKEKLIVEVVTKK